MRRLVDSLGTHLETFEERLVPLAASRPVRQGIGFLAVAREVDRLCNGSAKRRCILLGEVEQLFCLAERGFAAG